MDGVVLDTGVISFIFFLHLWLSLKFCNPNFHVLYFASCFVLYVVNSFFLLNVVWLGLVTSHFVTTTTYVFLFLNHNHWHRAFFRSRLNRKKGTGHARCKHCPVDRVVPTNHQSPPSWSARRDIITCGPYMLKYQIPHYYQDIASLHALERRSSFFSSPLDPSRPPDLQLALLWLGRFV